FAVRYPDRVLALVLTSSGAAALPPKGLDDDVRESISRYGTKEENRALFEAAVPRYFDALNVTLEDLDNFVETALLATNPALRGTLETLYASPPISREEYAAIKTPTLIIVGTHDPFGTFDQAVVLSDVLPKSKITVMARCGHSPMWEKPIEFVKVLADFLEDNGLK
ncbi:MAG TPA: alpha/beta fold hydrolase, partial [Geobacteraceae bacterium]